jgi:hypothetical protein
MESLVHRHVIYPFPMDHVAPSPSTGEILQHQWLQEIYRGDL